MLKIIKIPNAKTKLNFWKFIYEYSDNYNFIINPVKVLKSVNFVLFRLAKRSKTPLS